MQSSAQFFERVEPLPAAPSILPKLLAALADPQVNVGDVVLLISAEPVLAAKVLKLCNSAYFGGSAQTADIDEAVARLGFQAIYSLVVAAAGQTLLATAQPEWGLDTQALWKHSVLSGVAAELLARDFGEDWPPALFTAGLLHDFGKLIVAWVFKSHYGRLVKQAEETQKRLLYLERVSYDVDHAEIGGYLLERWNFPQFVIAAVRFHHAPDTAGQFVRPAAIVAVANSVAHLMLDPSPVDREGQQQGYQKLNIAEDARDYLERLRPQMDLVESISQV